MPDAVRALALSAALLVVVSGLAKLRTPAPAGRLLLALRVPRPLRSTLAVRTLGCGEIAIGAAQLLLASRWTAVALAAAYLGFAVTVAVAVRRGTSVACGCFGGGDAAPGRAHLAVTVLAASVAIAAAVRPGHPAWDGTAGLVLAAQTALVAWLGYLVLTLLPDLAGARRRLLEESS